MKRVSKYVNQTKVINDLSFTTISYSKGKLEIKADGFDGSLWCGTQTWKTKESGAIVTKRSSFHSESKRFKECFTKAEVIETYKEEVPYDTDLDGLDLNLAAYTFKEHFQELVTKELRTDFNNLNIVGGIIYKTAQDKIESFERGLNKVLNEETNNFDKVRNIVYSNEWRTTWRKIYTDFFINNWDEIWSNTIRKWCKFHGISEEEYYDDSRNIVDTYETSKYDYLFDGCSTVKEVKRIYRKWSKQLHPDMGGNAEDFKELNKAYDSALKQAKLIEDILSGEGIDIEDIDEVVVPVCYLVA